jgi:hypothetical protein
MLSESDSLSGGWPSRPDGRHASYRVEGAYNITVTATIVVTADRSSIRPWMELYVLWTVQS